MHICFVTFAGISLRLCYVSHRSFRITFAAYLPTHIKSLWDFFQLLNNHRDNLYIIPLSLLVHSPLNAPIGLCSYFCLQSYISKKCHLWQISETKIVLFIWIWAIYFNFLCFKWQFKDLVVSYSSHPSPNKPDEKEPQKSTNCTIRYPQIV